jgi:cytochrome c553
MLPHFLPPKQSEDKSMKNIVIAVLSTALGLASGAVLAGDPAAGKAKADACIDCHESDDFAGESAASIEAMIRAAQAGEVKHDKVIKDLDEADIADVAAYFAHEGAR